MHPAAKLRLQLESCGVRPVCAEPLQHLLNATVINLRIHRLEPRQKILIRERDRRPLFLRWHLNEQMKMVAHNTVGKHPHTAERLILAHHTHEHVLFLATEHKLPIHNTGNAMVERRSRLSRGGEETGLAHNVFTRTHYADAVKFFLLYSWSVP